MGITLEEVHRMKPSDVQWNDNAYPLVMNDENMRFHRASCIKHLEDRNIPYLVTTECDGCPHKDPARWRRTSKDTLKEVAEWEEQFGGEYFLTRSCIPLLEAVQGMEDGESMAFDSCDSGYCFV